MAWRSTYKKHAAIFNWAFLVFCLLFCLGLFLRNLPNSVLYQYISGVDRNVYTPLGLYHRGWAMFAGGPTTQTIMVQLVYSYKNGKTEVETPFPLRTGMRTSAWNEVMEDLLIRDDNFDTNRQFLTGFFLYQCRTRFLDSTLATAEIQHAFVPLQELYRNGGEPRNTPRFKTVASFQCP